VVGGFKQCITSTPLAVEYGLQLHRYRPTNVTAEDLMLLG
jgi:hypothetical protein